MLIAFAGASGRTDASHAALLVAHATVAVEGRATLITVGDGPAPAAVPGLRVVQLPGASTAAEVNRAVEDCRREGALTAIDVPTSFPRGVRCLAAVDLAVLVVGPHEADEREAAARVTADRPSGRTAYLGCRRAGGGPAARSFAAAITALDPDAEVIGCVLPPLTRGEAAALSAAAPVGRGLRAGLLLLAALRSNAGSPRDGEFVPLEAAAQDEQERIAIAADARSLSERLRDLADDVESVAAGCGPSAADIAEAPILDAWEYGIVPVRVLRGRVSGHPDIADGRPARTSEVYLTDRMTWARTLSRWYRLRTPADGAAPDLH